jgi:hypothetical protein
MAKQTKAFGVFKNNVERSRAFLRIFAKDRGRGGPNSDDRELLRGCLVFAVGALDAYLSDVILEIVPVFGSTSEHMKKALKEIGRDDPGLALRVSISKTAAEGREQFRAALSEWLDGKSFQGVEKVSNAINYLGCTMKLDDIQALHGKKTTTELTRITKDRHRIVHSGTKIQVTQPKTEEAITLVLEIAKAIDSKVAATYLSK